MRKRLLCLIFALVLLAPAAANFASADSVTEHIEVTSFDPDVNYSAEIMKCLEDGSEYAMHLGAIYEKMRNLKIDTLHLDYEKSYYFSLYSTAEEILQAMGKRNYTDEDLDLLARIVYAEVGSDWIPNWVQRAVASVVINRVNSPLYPNTIREVIFQEGQYTPAYSGAIYQTPNARAYENARYVLENGVTIPEGVLGQSQEIQGAVYTTYYDYTLGTTTYFCYI